MNKNKKKTDLQEQGFTLIELLVVMAILAVLATMIAPKLMDKPDDAKRVKAAVDMQSLGQALKFYKLDNGNYPSTEQGLRALVEAPSTGKLPKKWRKGGYLEKKKLPKDPWGNDYVYVSPGVHGDFDITSYGADGEPGGDDKGKDINNWEIE